MTVAQGSPTTTGVPVDIATHLTRLEKQLEQLRTQVHQAQQLASLGTAAATIAHEVNNLLTPLLSYASAALDSSDQDLKDLALRKTVRHVDMLVKMADRVLAIGADHRTEAAMVRVREVAAEAVGSLCRDLDRDGIRLTIDVPDNLQAFVDPLQLQQVLFNLLLNAREVLVADRGGAITIRACHEESPDPRNDRPEGRVLITVNNSGRPIPADFLPHVFNALHSRGRGEGSKDRCRGLGLALCKSLVEENGGTIQVDSGAGQGTTFTMSLSAGPPEQADA